MPDDFHGTFNVESEDGFFAMFIVRENIGLHLLEKSVYYETQMPYKEAISYCEQFNSHILNLNSPEIFQIFQNFLSDKNLDTYAWIDNIFKGQGLVYNIINVSLCWLL